MDCTVIQVFFLLSVATLRLDFFNTDFSSSWQTTAITICYNIAFYRNRTRTKFIGSNFRCQYENLLRRSFGKEWFNREDSDFGRRCVELQLFLSQKCTTVSQIHFRGSSWANKC